MRRFVRLDPILMKESSLRRNPRMSKGMEDPRFSSSFSVVFLNFFHHDANSRLEGGERAPWVIPGEGAPRGGAWFCVCCVVIDAEFSVAIQRRTKLSWFRSKTSSCSEKPLRVDESQSTPIPDRGLQS